MAFVNRQRMTSGSAIASAMNQEPPSSRGSARGSKDHMAANVAAMRAAARERKAAATAASTTADPAPFKMKRFAGVKSKLATSRPSSAAQGGEEAPRPKGRESKEGRFLKRGAGRTLASGATVSSVGAAPTEVAPHRRRGGSRKAAVPTREELAAAAAAHPSSASEAARDFIRANAAQAAALTPPKPTHATRATEREGYGQVPGYLQARKAVWAEAEAEAEAARADPDCPPGMVAMPEEERLTMLAQLTAAEAEVKGRIARLPLVLETHAARRRADALEAELGEVVEALAVFARPKVYISPE